MVSEPGSSDLGSSFRSSTSSLPCHFKPRRSFMVQLAVQPLQEEDVLIHGVLKLSLVVLHSLMSALKKAGHWKHVQAFPIHCPRRKLSRRKLSTCYWSGNLNMKKGGVFGMVGSRRKATQRRRGWLPNQQLISDHT